MNAASNWQDLAALGMVLTAAAYLGRAFWFSSTGRGAGRSCATGGGCHGCPQNHGQADGPGCSDPISIGLPGGRTPAR